MLGLTKNTDINGLQELKAWVEQSQPRFTKENYTVDDIERLAIACGFKRRAIDQWKAAVSREA